MSDIRNATELSDLTSEDYLDTRDLEDLRKRLEDELAAVGDDDEEPEATLDAIVYDGDLDDARALLKVLNELRDEVSEWSDGNTLIRESYWAEHVEDEAEQLGYITSKQAGQWPFRHIDWEAAARDLRQDYSESTIDGVAYLWRQS